MTIKNFFNNRLWKNNSSLVQLLGLCPVLAMTSNSVNALGLGITTTLVLTITNTLISIFKKFIPKDIRIPIYMMIISSMVTCIEMLLHAYQFELYKSLGVFVPLIVTNCIVVGRADFIAYKHSILFSFLDGLFIGLGATLAMLLVGSIREMIGNGTLFFGINKILLTMNNSFFITVIHKNFTVSLASLPPGGFFILGMIIAFKNFLDLNKKKNVLSNCLKCVCKNTLKK